MAVDDRCGDRDPGPRGAVLLALARSPEANDRLRACAELAGRTERWALSALRELLYDTDDLAPIREAAAALLEHGDAGWDWVLEAVWRSEGPDVAHGLVAAMVDRFTDGRDTEDRLEQRATRSPSPDAGRGAREAQMILGIVPMAYIPDEDER